ncbi:MAG: ketoacyl-ACP synthase III [Alphaproteobacteria bacterium]|nr:ketoacyl-ACP synthase III [Alphaproteobacteria bacterium]
MARSVLKGVRIAGLSVCVPKTVIDNLEVPPEEQQSRDRLVRNIGIRYRRICEEGIIFSDLAEAATNDVLAGVGWHKSTVDDYIFVTQSPEYIMPSRSIVCQHRVGLPKTTLAFDINLGCSGYPYGLYTVGRMLGAHGLKRAVVVVGDQSASRGAKDSGREILFGDACSATALEFDETAPDIFFEGFSDGSGYKAIYVPDGGHRNPLTPYSLIPTECADGVIRKGIDVSLDGPAILNFSIEVAPAAVHSICEFSGVALDSVDRLIFHQANKMINDTIRRKLKRTPEQVPESLYDYGNTSSTSVPTTIVYRAREQFLTPGTKFILCGFGIGLSWATMLVETTPNTYCSTIFEV